jgi:hypothetical protein
MTNFVICREFVKTLGIPEEEIFGTAILFSVPLGEFRRKGAAAWRKYIVQERFSDEGIEVMLRILEQEIPGKDHRGEYREVRESVQESEIKNFKKFDRFMKSL